MTELTEQELQITGLHTVTQQVKLDLRKLECWRSYDYAIIAPSGKTVGWLRERMDGSFTIKMVDNSFKIFGAIIRSENGEIEMIRD